jgi:hypothetical protein
LLAKTSFQKDQSLSRKQCSWLLIDRIGPQFTKSLTKVKARLNAFSIDIFGHLFSEGDCPGATLKSASLLCFFYLYAVLCKEALPLNISVESQV